MYLHGKMEKNMKAAMYKIKKKAMVNFFGQMEIGIKDIGNKVNKMVKVLFMIVQKI